MRTIRSILLSMLLLEASLANALSISDGEFTGWTFSGTGTVSVTREATGGNPGARLNVTTVSGPTVYGVAVKPDYSTTEPLSGLSFTLALDILSGPGSYGDGQAITLIVSQNATLYQQQLANTGYPRNWDTLTFTGVFDELAFTRIEGPGPIVPDFAGGQVTLFGFAAGNRISGTLTQYYDNFSLQAVPEANTATLLLAGLLSVLLAIHLVRGRQTVDA